MVEKACVWGEEGVPKTKRTNADHRLHAIRCVYAGSGQPVGGKSEAGALGDGRRKICSHVHAEWTKGQRYTDRAGGAADPAATEVQRRGRRTVDKGESVSSALHRDGQVEQRSAIRPITYGVVSEKAVSKGAKRDQRRDVPPSGAAGRGTTGRSKR